ncbi:MAG: TonB-dependent receptor, partial [Holophagales bacterium]|nr:TonB-dependent receptor [Holophagales bacterium]
MRKNLVLTPLMALIASGGGAIVAQDLTSAVLAGRVTSQDGVPLQGVRVLLESSSLLQTRQVATDASGQFRVPLLPNGNYNVTYTLNGYITRRLTLQIIAGQVINGGTRLTSVTAQEATVEITATSTSQVDKTDTVVQTSFSADFLRQLKNPSDLLALGELVPGIDMMGNGNIRPRVRGGSIGGGKILFDGQTAMEGSAGYLGSTAKLPQDLVESVAVLQSPTNAKYGNTDGGIISMVTSKGSNSFNGTFRITGLRRSFWNATDRGYPTREGNLNTVNPPNDNLGRNYEYTIKGPLWKNHITFAYAGRIVPPNERTESWNRGQWSNPSLGPRPQDQVGLYYQDPTNGLVVRRSELGGLQNPYDVFGYVVGLDLYNHFTLYAQITPDHQFEYSYRDNMLQWGSPRSPVNNSNSREILPQDSDDGIARFWTLAYKGIIGNSGVLEVRHGYNVTGWTQPGVNEHVSHRVYTIPSVVPHEGTYSNNNWIINNYSNNDPSNFMASGYVDLILNATGAGYRNHSFGGRNDVATGATGGTASTTINYQHVLNTTKGTHLIDMGIQNDKFDWTNAVDPEWYWWAPGQLPYNMTSQDFYNPRGVPINISDYAGKFIVFNVYQATLGDLDPNGIARYIANGGTGYTANTRLFDGAPIAGAASGLSNFYPRVQHRYGEGSAAFYTQMRSYYINDLWSINDNHSVMLGVRLDNWTLWESSRDIHSYIKPTLRFEYKWDIHGDQSRVMNLSLNQYHNANYNGLFRQFTNAPQPNNEWSYWNKSAPDGSNRPYLVSYSEFTNPANYGPVYSSTSRDLNSFVIDPDWKAATTNEFSVGFARNLSNGGFWKITFVSRTWSDQYDFFPGDVYKNNLGNNQVRAVLKNT